MDSIRLISRWLEPSRIHINGVLFWTQYWIKSNDHFTLLPDHSPQVHLGNDCGHSTECSRPLYMNASWCTPLGIIHTQRSSIFRNYHLDEFNDIPGRSMTAIFEITFACVCCCVICKFWCTLQIRGASSCHPVAVFALSLLRCSAAVLPSKCFVIKSAGLNQSSPPSVSLFACPSPPLATIARMSVSASLSRGPFG